MGCNFVPLENGGFAILCSGRARQKPCGFCGRPSTKLCDAPAIRKGRDVTCDVPLCNACATPVDAETDYCPLHRRLDEEAAEEEAEDRQDALRLHGGNGDPGEMGDE